MCKRWRDALRDDDVWKIYCDREISHLERMAERFQDDEPRAQHFILTKEIPRRRETSKSLFDIFLLSQRLGSRLYVHQRGGPECQRKDRDNYTVTMGTLRQTCLRDVQFIVNPTLEALRGIFEDGRDDRQGLISAMKTRLLTHAQAGNEVLSRDGLRYVEQGRLALLAGQYIVASASFEGEQLDVKSVFTTSSIMKEVSISDIVQGVEKISGEELNVELSVRIKRTLGGDLEKVVSFQPSMKKMSSNMCDLDWPIYPVDALHYFLRHHWDYGIDTSDIRRGEQESDKDYRARSDAAREACKRNWWESLATPLNNLIREACNEAYGERLPEVLPYETLDLITQRGDTTLSQKIQEIIWRDCQLFDAMVKVYRQHCIWFSGMIRDHYLVVYGDAESSETATILLDVFLEVTTDPPIPKQDFYTSAGGNPGLSSLPKMTTSYCESLPQRINETLDRWNNLAQSAQEDDDVAWSQRTLAELDELADKFDCSDYGRSELMGPSHHELNPDTMIARFMYDTLSSGTRAFDRSKIKEDIKNTISSFEEFNANNQPPAMALEVSGKCRTAADEFRRFSHYMHIREHAMLALIPLLPSMSKRDSEKLVWACFVDKTFSRCSRGVTFHSFYSDDIPCCKDEEDPMRRLHSDWAMAFQWGMEHRLGTSTFGSKGVNTRLFGLPLPRNILLAMSDFLVRNLYREDLRDVGKGRIDSIFRILPYLERSCAVTPELAHIVWEGLGQAIGNAASVAQQYDFEEISPRDMLVFQQVVRTLIGSCIVSRAERAIPSLRTAFQGTSGEILADIQNLAPLNVIEQRINAKQTIYQDSFKFEYD